MKHYVGVTPGWECIPTENKYKFSEDLCNKQQLKISEGIRIPLLAHWIVDFLLEVEVAVLP